MRRRRRDRGAKGAEIETPKASTRGMGREFHTYGMEVRGMGREFPLPIRLRGLGERYELPQRGPGGVAAQNEFGAF